MASGGITKEGVRKLTSTSLNLALLSLLDAPAGLSSVLTRNGKPLLCLARLEHLARVRPPSLDVLRHKLAHLVYHNVLNLGCSHHTRLANVHPKDTSRQHLEYPHQSSPCRLSAPAGSKRGSPARSAPCTHPRRPIRTRETTFLAGR